MDMNKVYGIPLDFLVYKAEELLWERYEAAQKSGLSLPFYVPLEYARDCHFSIRNSEGIGGGTLSAALNGVVVASGVDSFTGATYGALGNASSIVLAKKT